MGLIVWFESPDRDLDDLRSRFDIQFRFGSPKDQDMLFRKQRSPGIDWDVFDSTICMQNPPHSWELGKDLRKKWQRQALVYPEQMLRKTSRRECFLQLSSRQDTRFYPHSCSIRK